MSSRPSSHGTVLADSQTPAGSGSHGGSAASRPLDTTALIARLWTQNLPIMRERVSVLERAAQDAQSAALTDAQRDEAVQISHKLAGSLGMFGYPEGTQIARNIEALLESEGAVEPLRFLELSAALRSALPL